MRQADPMIRQLLFQASYQFDKLRALVSQAADDLQIPHPHLL
jgi:hypothetical protein